MGAGWVGEKMRNARNLMRYFAPENRFVVTLIISLEILIYWPYMAGVAVINGDANAHYLSDAFFWWNNGGIISPPQWVSYAWMGRPGGSNLQDSSYFLPAGLANWLIGWSPTSIALTNAAIAGVGALGAYLLVRRMGFGRKAATLALIGQFFAPGIFSNAQFLDFQHGAAFAPWILLIASPAWPWQKRWSVPLAALVLWQIAVGTYPGQLIATFYVLVAWWAGWALAGTRRRQWFLKFVLAAALAGALSAVKFVPAIMLGTGSRDLESQRISTTFNSLGSIFFPSGNQAFISDVALRSYFVPITIVLGTFLFSWKSRKNAPIAMSVLVSSLLLALCMAWPHFVATNLPGLSASRVLVNDFRNASYPLFLVAGSVGLARWNLYTLRYRRLVLLALAIIMVGFAVNLNMATFKNSAGICATFFIFLGLTLVMGQLWIVKGKTLREQKIVVLLAFFTVASGTLAAYATPQTWVSSKRNVEVGHFGQPFAALAQRPCPTSLQQRPARTEPKVGSAEFEHDTLALTAAFDCAYSVDGYVNVQGSPTLRDQSSLLSGRGVSSVDYLKFVEAPSAMVPVTNGGLKSASIRDSCMKMGNCEGIVAHPDSYNPLGSMSFNVDAIKDTRVLVNESYYLGWQAQICNREKVGCHSTPVSSGFGKLISLNIPKGFSEVKLSYQVPLYLPLRIIFMASGFATLFGLLWTTLFVRFRRRINS